MTLTLNLPPDVEDTLSKAARQQGTTPEHPVPNGLRNLFMPQEVVSPEVMAWDLSRFTRARLWQDIL